MFETIFTTILSTWHSGGLITKVLMSIIGVASSMGVYMFASKIIGLVIKGDKTNDNSKSNKEQENTLQNKDLIIKTLIDLGMNPYIKLAQKGRMKRAINKQNLHEHFKITDKGIEYAPNTKDTKYYKDDKNIDERWLKENLKTIIDKLGSERLIPYECLLAENNWQDSDIDFLKNLYKKIGKHYPFTNKRYNNKIFMSEEEWKELQSILQVEAKKDENTFQWLRDRFLKYYNANYFGNRNNQVKVEKRPIGNWYLLRFLDKASLAKVRFQQNLISAGLFFNNDINGQDDKIAPIVYQDENKDIIIKKINSTDTIPTDRIEKAFNWINDEFDVECLKVDKLEDNSGWRVMVDKPRSDLDFTRPLVDSEEIKDENGATLEVINNTNEDMIERWEKAYQKSIAITKALYGRQEQFFFGEVQDPSISLETKQFFDIDRIVHMMIIGGTGSGKTTSAISMIYSMARMCQDLEGGADWYFADGKSAQDWVSIAKLLSNYPVAMPREGTDDPLIELANVFILVWKEYKRRQELFQEKSKELGVNISKIYDYRAYVGEMKRVFIVIDEFRVFKTMMGDFNSPPDKSIPQMIMRLASEARSYGITLIFISQSPKDETFPNKLKENLPTKIIHRVDSKVGGYLGTLFPVEKLNKGENVLNITDFACPETLKTDIRFRFPFLGGGYLDLYKKYFKEIEHKSYDYELLYNNGKGDSDITSQKVQNPIVAKYIKKRFLDDEGWTITKQLAQYNRVDTKELFIVAEKGDNKIAIGFLDKNKLNVALYNKPTFGLVEKEYKPDMYIFITPNFFDYSKDKVYQQLRTTNIDNDYLQKTYFISSGEVKDFLVLADEAFLEGEEHSYFSELLNNAMIFRNTTVGEFADNEVSGVISNSVNLKDKDVKLKEDIVISNQFIADLEPIQDNTTKGDWFELFVAKLYEGLGYKAWLVNDLLDDPLCPISRDKKTSTGDGGVDVIIEDPNTGIRRGIQCKCYFKDNTLGAGVFGEIVSAYQEWKAEKNWMFHEIEIITNQEKSNDGFTGALIQKFAKYTGEKKVVGNPIADITLGMKNSVDPNEPKLYIVGGSGLKKLIAEYQRRKKEEEDLKDNISNNAEDYFIVENGRLKSIVDLNKAKSTKRNPINKEEELSKIAYAILSKYSELNPDNGKFEIDPQTFQINRIVNNKIQEVYHPIINETGDNIVPKLKLNALNSQLKKQANNIPQYAILNTFLPSNSEEKADYETIIKSFTEKGLSVIDASQLTVIMNTLIWTMENSTEIEDEDLETFSNNIEEEFSAIEEIEKDIEDDIQEGGEENEDFNEEDFFSSILEEDSIEDDIFGDIGEDIVLDEPQTKEDPKKEEKQAIEAPKSPPKEFKEEKVNKVSRKGKAGAKPKTKSFKEIAKIYGKEMVNSGSGRPSKEEMAQRKAIAEEFEKKLNEEYQNGIISLTGKEKTDYEIKKWNELKGE